ncbi:MAG TPA: glycine zipper 2TM domain-containing protein [Verrucomicrobiota bacterium]|nr:glycine zipper 2TM domain-containing protein [Verrucomicrobiota bacterium]HPU56638.1 glycine zipper 2TM domain-containing protein [Verrucomicrobiota bacterium]
MLNTRSYRWLALGAGTLLLVSTGCENLPGSDEQQGAVIGGVGGAVAGAAIGGEEHRVLGALLGGALGAGGGYIIGANADRITGRDTQGAQRASQTAQTQPATPQQARNASTADVNQDGFVTLDEVVALDQAGLSDQQIIDRVAATGQVFELTDEQERHLMDQGVSRQVVTQMRDLNRATRERLLQEQDVISQPPR